MFTPSKPADSCMDREPRGSATLIAAFSRTGQRANLDTAWRRTTVHIIRTTTNRPVIYTTFVCHGLLLVTRHVIDHLLSK